MNEYILYTENRGGVVRAWSPGGRVGHVGAELVARGRSFFLGSKVISLEAKFFGNSV
jgi:hypothetical protein